MKTAYAVCGLLFLITASIEARVGETKAEIEARYGKGGLSDIQRQPGATTYKYFKNGFQIEVVIHEGKSMWEIIEKIADRYTSDQDIQDVLEGYRKAGESWKFDKAKKVWEKSGVPRLVAYRWPGHEGYLCIKDAKAVEALDKKNPGAKGL